MFVTDYKNEMITLITGTRQVFMDINTEINSSVQHVKNEMIQFKPRIDEMIEASVKMTTRSDRTEAKVDSFNSKFIELDAKKVENNEFISKLKETASELDGLNYS